MGDIDALEKLLGGGSRGNFAFQKNKRDRKVFAGIVIRESFEEEKSFAVAFERLVEKIRI